MFARDDCLQLIEDTRTKLLAIINNQAGWNKKYNRSGIHISSKKSEYFEGKMFKATMEFDAPFDKVAKTVAPSPPELQKEWNKNITSVECIKYIDEEVIVVRTVTPKAGLISSRECIDLGMLRFEDDGETAIFVYISVEYPGYPITDGLVRAKNFPCGAIFRKIDAARSHMTYIWNMSYEGSVPVSVLESGMPYGMYNTMLGLQKYIAKDYPSTNTKRCVLL
ncbi:stAR-related lipid transfer protein 5-like [Amphiura filiformis]|uniref:stAR-related lipid transfer protein 5-like n=1 Tax=Amphiura filiformis TaxID=82378 RepID=UPI003B216266